MRRYATKNDERDRIFRQLRGDDATWLANIELARGGSSIRKDPSDPMNWSIGSVNRQRSMYKNYFREIMPPKAEDIVRKLIEPSPFLKKHLDFQPKLRRRRVACKLAPVFQAQPSPRAKSPAKKKKKKPRTKQRFTCLKESNKPLFDDSSPRGYVYRPRPPLFLRSCGNCYLYQGSHKRSMPSPLPDTARELVKSPSSSSVSRDRTLRFAYGPSSCYPSRSVDSFVRAYWSTLLDGQPFGARTTIKMMTRHRVVAENAYFRKQVENLENEDASFSFKELLRIFFPLMKPGEIRDIALYYQGTMNAAGSGDVALETS